MKNLRTAVIVTLASVLALLASETGLVSGAQTTNGQIDGIWLGAIAIDEDSKMRIAFEISKGDSGALKATFASIDQNAFGIPVKSVTCEEGKLVLDVAAIGGVYEGKRLDATTINGHLKQGDREPAQIVLK